MKKFSLSSLLFVVAIQFMGLLNVNAQSCWAALGSGAGPSPIYNYVFALSTYNDNLIVGGAFDTVGGQAISDIASWNGSSWSGLGSGMNSGSVSALAVYNNELYVAGSFNTAGGVIANKIAKWDGTSWSAIGTGITGTIISSLEVYKGVLYAGGVFNTAGGIRVHNLAGWDGTSWLDIAGGISGRDSSVSCLKSLNSKLYVGGTFEYAGNISAQSIAVWNDTSWSALGYGVGDASGGSPEGVFSIADYNGNIYVAGFLSVAGNTFRNIAEWDENSWTEVGGGVNMYGFIYSVFSLNGNLLACGNFNTAGSEAVSNIAQWNGTEWSGLQGGIGGTISQASGYAMDTFNGNLFVGGLLSLAGNTNITNIAEYTCPTAITEIPVNKIQVYPNPTTGILHILIDNLHDKATIQIYNLMGQRVMQSNLNTDKAEINLTGEAAGTYFYRITGANSESIGTGNFVVQ